MAITSSPRLGITRWSDPADPFTRAQMEADHAALDNLAAIDVAGLLASRPAAGVRGRYYATTDATKRLYRDDGTTWRELFLLETGGTVTGALTMNNPITMAAGQGIVTDTTTGSKISFATTQKLGFFGATPIVQPANTVDPATAMSNLGLRAAGGSWTMDAGTTGILKAGQSVQTGALFAGPYAGGGFVGGTSLRVLGSSSPATSPNNYVRVDVQGTPADTHLVLMAQGTGGIVGITSNPQVPLGTFAVNANGNTMSFYGQTLTARQTITGSRGGNAALANLLAALSTVGLIFDSTTA